MAKKNRVQEKGYGKLLWAQKQTNKIGHWEENKGILTLGHNNDQKKLGSNLKKGLKNFGPTKRV